MPSRADVPRAALEWLLRAASIGLLVLLLLRVLHPEQEGRAAVVADADAMRTALASWTIRPVPALHVKLASVPTPQERDWLRALSRAGTTVTWEGDRVPATAATVTRMIDPVPMWRATVAAPQGSRVVLRDNLGVIDTVQTASFGARAVLPSLQQRFGASVNGTTAWAAVQDSIVLKKLLVEGQAGWETKFAIAALQERGWTVDALTHVAPGVDVREGTPAAPDTSRYAAVVAIDTSATLIAQSAGPYVRSGGGLVTLHDATGIGPAGSPAVVLEKRSDGTMTAYRSGQGRVLHIGYPEVWRNRVPDREGTPDPVAANRAWWGDVIASVAYAPRISMRPETTADPAPLASLFDRIGAPSPAARSPSTARAHVVPIYLLFAMLLGALLLEWMSRRLRGEP